MAVAETMGYTPLEVITAPAGADFFCANQQDVVHIRQLFDRYQADQLRVAVTEHQTVESRQEDSALVHDRYRGFIKAADGLIRRCTEYMAATGLDMLTVATEEYGIAGGCLVQQPLGETVWYGDVIFTNEQLDAGYRLATQYEWAALLVGMDYTAY